MSDALTAVSVEHASKHFRLRHTHSLKESLVWTAQGRSRHEDFVALAPLDLEIRQGESVALLGRNGSGKSTLLKIVAGVMAPDTGRVRVRGRLAGLLEVGAGFHPDLTGRENVHLNASILGMRPAQIRERFDEIVEFADIGPFLDTQVRFYSSGMFLRLAFAVAVHTDPDVFLVDEILAVGDEAFRRQVPGPHRAAVGRGPHPRRRQPRPAADGAPLRPRRRPRPRPAAWSTGRWRRPSRTCGPRCELARGGARAGRGPGARGRPGARSSSSPPESGECSLPPSLRCCRWLSSPGRRWRRS